jgi:DNA mismatch repair protein MutS
MQTSPEDERAVSVGVEAPLTPAMRQYRAAKQEYPDALLFFRMGDFYELFFEDAVVASRELQLTLTARDKARSVPMCGVPYHAAEGYLQRLLRRGFRVAICEQMEDPKLAKGVVKREVTRVLTPGTAVDSSLGSGESCWMAAITAVGTQREGACVGLAVVDLSTGEFRATEFSGRSAWSQAVDELGRLRPVELLYSQGLMESEGRKSVASQLSLAEAGGSSAESALQAFEGIRTKTALESWVFHPEHAVPLLQAHFRVHSLDGMGFSGRESAITAAGAVLEYLKRTKQGALEHLDSLRYYEQSTCLELDAVTVRNLELVDPLFAGEDSHATLLWTMDACLTPMGKRLLRATLLRPGKSVTALGSRYDAVDEAVSDLRKRADLRRALDGLLDLERLLGRVALDSAGPRDLVALARSLARLPALMEVLTSFQAALWRDLQEGFDALDDVEAHITRTLADEPPLSIGDPGAIRSGVSTELDDLRELGQNGRQAVAAIEERERARTGIGSLKVRFNNVFGYYLEVTKANVKSVPADYERKQTLVNAERFTTPELKELETRILHAQERCGEIERRIFGELRAVVLKAATRLRATARRVAEIDLTGSYAEQAVRFGWVRPEVDETGVIEIVHGRHPVVERRMEETGVGRFVPNSLFLEAGGQDGANGPSISLITGPNMGGKSTYLRMAALLAVMAQAGSFVPAKRFRIGLVDRVFTRIGASDNVARGRSTFMVEMTETAAILNAATSRSLILLDEMGRGTATYDGLSLAWSAVEYLHNSVRARTLFATHYHELTLLSERLEQLRNLRVTVKETGGGIVFLHTVEAGAASKSYGIEVARLAGLPSLVIERAREVLRMHERAEAEGMHAAGTHGVTDSVPAVQMTMFTPLSQRIVNRVGALNLDEMTPREAMNLLAELQRELKA